MRGKRLIFTLTAGLGFTLTLFLLLNTNLSRAATFTVTRFDDPTPNGCFSGTDCSLREAIIDANIAPDGDTIILGSGTYFLNLGGGGEENALTGDLDITRPLTITGQGPGATIIDANLFSGIIERVFDVKAGATTVVISGVTITGGAETIGSGAGIFLDGADLTLINADITNNQALASAPPGQGGGIFVASGNLLLQNSQVTANIAADGGYGIHLETGGATLDSSLVGLHSGPGVYVRHGTFNQIGSSSIVQNVGGVIVEEADATFFMQNGTIANNTGANTGGGILVFSGTVCLEWRTGVQQRRCRRRRCCRHQWGFIC